MTMVNIIKKADNPDSDEARALQRSILDRERKGLANLSPEDQVMLATDLLRMRVDKKRQEQAINLLQPLTLRPPPSLEFLVLAHQAFGHLVREAYDQAYTAQESALYDYEFPKQLLGLSAAQLKWYRHLEKDYYLPFMRNRRDEARLGKGYGRDLLDPIFLGGSDGHKEPVHFVGDSGEYEAGSIAERERAKLPRDAIAVVQQMILWNPADARLWWQLAELYNAAGELRSAARLFRHLREEKELIYSNHETRMHEAAVLSALETQRNAEEARKKAEDEVKRRAEDDYAKKRAYVWVGIAVVVVLVGYWQARELARRLRSRRAKAAIQAGLGNHMPLRQ
jgi:hypothetical protein